MCYERGSRPASKNPNPYFRRLTNSFQRILFLFFLFLEAMVAWKDLLHAGRSFTNHKGIKKN